MLALQHCFPELAGCYVLNAKCMTARISSIAHAGNTCASPRQADVAAAKTVRPVPVPAMPSEHLAALSTGGLTEYRQAVLAAETGTANTVQQTPRFVTPLHPASPNRLNSNPQQQVTHAKYCRPFWYTTQGLDDQFAACCVRGGFWAGQAYPCIAAFVRFAVVASAQWCSHDSADHSIAVGASGAT